MRGIVSASGIRFFSEGDQNLSGERTHESCRSRCDLGEGGAQALFLECVELTDAQGDATLSHAIEGKAGVSREGIDAELLQG